MTDQNQPRDFGLDRPASPARDGAPVPDEGVREMPTDPPEVVPSMSAEQPTVAAGIGLAGFARADPEGGLVGDEEYGWQDEPDMSDGAFPAEAGER